MSGGFFYGQAKEKGELVIPNVFIKLLLLCLSLFTFVSFSHEAWGLSLPPGALSPVDITNDLGQRVARSRTES